MYLKAFDGKRNGAAVQRGYSLIQLLVVMLLVSILATAALTAYRESVRSANLRAAHAALLEMRALWSSSMRKRAALS